MLNLFSSPLEEDFSKSLQVNCTVSPQSLLFGDFFSVKIEALILHKQNTIVFSSPEEKFFQNAQLIKIKHSPLTYSWKEKKYKTSIKLDLQAIQTPFVEIPSISISVLQNSVNLYTIKTEPIHLKVQSRLTDGGNWEIHPIRMDYFSYTQPRFWKVYFFIFLLIFVFIYYLWKKITHNFKDQVPHLQKEFCLLQRIFLFSEEFFLSKPEQEKNFLYLLSLCVKKSAPQYLTTHVIKKLEELRFSKKKIAIADLMSILQQAKELLKAKNT